MSTLPVRGRMQSISDLPSHESRQGAGTAGLSPHTSSMNGSLTPIRRGASFSRKRNAMPSSSARVGDATYAEPYTISKLTTESHFRLRGSPNAMKPIRISCSTVRAIGRNHGNASTARIG